MEPLYGALIYLAVSGVVWIVASKRGLRGWVFFVVCLVAWWPLAWFVANGTEFKSTGAGFAAFLVPLAAFIVAVSSKNSEQLAVETGQHGKYRKCPFCAESVRREAVKCKHCGSAIEPLPDAEPEPEPEAGPSPAEKKVDAMRKALGVD